MHVFYTPDIAVSNELPEEEAGHCLRVLRLGMGDEVMLTDGKGCFYKAVICIWLWHLPRIWTALNGWLKKRRKSVLMN